MGKQPAMMISIRRVRNGWIVCPNGSMSIDEFTNVASSISQLKVYVSEMAQEHEVLMTIPNEDDETDPLP